MNKLENEYKQLMQSETPDLWSRIEAGIDAGLAISEKVANGKVASKNAENVEVVDTDEVAESAERFKLNKLSTFQNSLLSKASNYFNWNIRLSLTFGIVHN